MAAALCLVVAELMLGGHRYPPGWDAQNHGLLTRNILVLGTTKITTVCVDGTTVPATTCHFYPLAMDVWWAQSAAFTHGMVSTSILTSAIVIGPLSLVVALYAAVRAMAASPVVAGRGRASARGGRTALGRHDGRARTRRGRPRASVSRSVC